MVLVVTEGGCPVDIDTNLELMHRGQEEFMRVKEIIHDAEEGIVIKGILFRRTNKVYNMIERKHNELCAMGSSGTEDTDPIPPIWSCLKERPLSSVVAIRDIVITNQPWPAHGVQTLGAVYKSWKEYEEKGRLVCRKRYIKLSSESWNVRSAALVGVQRVECDVGVPDSQLTRDWRRGEGMFKTPDAAPEVSHTPECLSAARPGGKRKRWDATSQVSDDEAIGTSSPPMRKRRRDSKAPAYRPYVPCTERPRLLAHSTLARLDEKLTSPRLHSQSEAAVKTYTYGDICAGAGGAASGAEQAGFEVVFALDNAKDPCQTLRLNFPSTRVIEKDVFEFCTGAAVGEFKVDVVHMSFPCNTYSTAHTRKGKDDEKNEAVGYSVIPILKATRPRVVTYEQSPNIARRYEQAFEAHVHQFTHYGFSVIWKVANLADHGCPQQRKRLLLIAACPGEQLPSFPKPTYGSGSGSALPAYRSISDAFEHLPAEIEPHMAQTVRRKDIEHFMPYNADRPLSAAITCNGGAHDLHPSGQRSFNHQERAQLQGFSTKHKFVGKSTSLKRQIGNAAPPIAMRRVFEVVRASLQERDNQRAAEQQVIVLD